MKTQTCANWRDKVLNGPTHFALHFFENGVCIICGQSVTGNLGMAAHLRKHCNAGELVSEAASHRGGAAHYGLPAH